jgi:P27 family predicted phage terminase small subunit
MARKANLKVVADNTPKMNDSGELPKLPSYLPSEVSEEWNNAVISLNDRGLLKNEVFPTLEAYMIAIWEVRDSLRQIEKDGRTFRAKNGEIKKNPAVSDLKIARDDVLRLAIALCLTPASQGAQSAPHAPTGQDSPDDGAPPGLVV